jgi:hypothetical protein
MAWPARSMLSLGLGISAVANALMAMLATGRVPYGLFAVAMTLAGVGAGLLNGETAKAMQGALPPARAGMAWPPAVTVTGRAARGPSGPHCPTAVPFLRKVSPRWPPDSPRTA